MDWTEEIRPGNRLLDLRVEEIWRYRDLLRMLVRRDFVAIYKQTILGPLWYFVQPLFTTITFTIVFGKIAAMPTDGIPQVLFYMSGITCWNYFAECLTKTATTFRDNQNLFGKVYFPRLVVPFSIVISNLLKFLIQFLLFMMFFIYYKYLGAEIHLNWAMLLMPLLLVMMAGLALGFGLIITSLTTKYRDLLFLLSFGVQLYMYATPIIYPLSAIPIRYRWLLALNPMTSILETFKYGLLGQATFDWSHLAYSFAFMCVLLLAGMILFNHMQKNFMDTI